MTLRVCIGVFAYNEADTITATLQSLLAQDIFAQEEVTARLVVLANGCRDGTADVARKLHHPALSVHDLPLSGKSRTWNRFVHDLSDTNSDVLIFADADILLPEVDALSRLAQGLIARPDLHALSSQPVKDLALTPDSLTLTERVIAASAGGLDDWQTAICGQLYAMPAPVARRYFMPVGLPVEDGFLRAMILTEVLTTPEDLSRIDGLVGLRHIYRSERHILPLLRHQVRIVIGSAVNAAIFAALRKLPPEERRDEIQTAARDDGWVPAVLKSELPRMPFGFVPVHFLVKRLKPYSQSAAKSGVRRALLAFCGVGFDAIVYIWAQIKMMRGTGAGHW